MRTAVVTRAGGGLGRATAIGGIGGRRRLGDLPRRDLDADARRQARRPEAAGSFSGHPLTPAQVAQEIGELTERPRPVIVLARPLLRSFDPFPSLTIRLLPLVMADARRRRRRYKRLIQAGRWPG
ncbi:MAG: hypothetical protein U0R26_09000 [Solirubrobacterales bacterium]